MQKPGWGPSHSLFTVEGRSMAPCVSLEMPIWLPKSVAHLASFVARKLLVLRSSEPAILYTCLGIMSVSSTLKPLVWIGTSKADLMRMPARVIRSFGFALYSAQTGGMHPDARPLHGFGSAGVLEIVEDWQGNAYRAVYTVRFKGAVFVLHVFQKKAKHGIETPKPEMDLIRHRLKAARHMAEEMR
jgi:phage-related protein